MILSNLEIQRALDEGRLLIEPQPQPRVPRADGGDCPYQTTAVDLTLGDESDRRDRQRNSVSQRQPVPGSAGAGRQDLTIAWYGLASP